MASPATQKAEIVNNAETAIRLDDTLLATTRLAGSINIGT
jgi:hypothetical protein